MKTIKNIFIVSIFLCLQGYDSFGQFRVWADGSTLTTASVSQWQPGVRAFINNPQGTCWDTWVGSPGNSIFFVHGTGWAMLQGTLYSGSDVRLKSNISIINDPIKLVQSLNGVMYNYRSPEEREVAHENAEIEVNYKNMNTGNDTMRIGFVAQDVQKVFPALVKEDSRGLLSVSYFDFVPLLVEAIKAQQLIIEELKESVAMLEANQTYNFDMKSELSKGDQQSSITLEQNVPNPFNTATKIRFTIPFSFESGFIYMHSISGEQVSKYPIDSKMGENELEISASSLKPGIYIYTLVVNGVIVGSKKMILEQI